MLFAVACASHAAPVWVADGLATLTSQAGGEQLVDPVPVNGSATCAEAREGCSAPIDLAPDLHDAPEAWTSFRVAHTRAALWPTRAVVTPDSPRELITLLLGRGVNDIRLADPQIVFSLGTPQLDLASSALVLADSRKTMIAPATGSTLGAKADSRAIPEESSVRLREMIEGLTENHTAHVQTPGKADTPLAYLADTARWYLGNSMHDKSDSAPGTNPRQPVDPRYQDRNTWTADALKSFGEMMASFMRAVRDIFS